MKYCLKYVDYCNSLNPKKSHKFKKKRKDLFKHTNTTILCVRFIQQLFSSALQPSVCFHALLYGFPVFRDVLLIRAVVVLEIELWSMAPPVFFHALSRVRGQDFNLPVSVIDKWAQAKCSASAEVQYMKAKSRRQQESTQYQMKCSVALSNSTVSDHFLIPTQRRAASTNRSLCCWIKKTTPLHIRSRLLTAFSPVLWCFIQL